MGTDSTKAKSGASRGPRTRREGVARRALDRLASPRLAMGVVITLAFVVLAGMLVAWTRDRPLVAVGRVMNETRIVRTELRLEDRQQTEQNRQAARQATPRVYAAIVPVLEDIENSLANLPRTLAAIDDLALVEKSIREQFNLDEELFRAVRQESVEGEPSQAWLSKVTALMENLKRRPILDAPSWQRSVQEGTHTTVRLLVGEKEIAPVFRGEVINADAKRSLEEAMQIAARDAGFVGGLRAVVVNRLTTGARPTYRLDEASTARDQNAAAGAVQTAYRVSPPGQVIYQRGGEALRQEQMDLLRAEAARVDEISEPWRRALKLAGTFAAVGAITLALVGYTVIFCPKIRRSPSRMAGVALILLSMLGAACLGGVAAPSLLAVLGVVPSILVTLIIGVGYDRRAALAFGLLHGLLACVALRASIGAMATIVTGIACVVAMVGTIRDRGSLLRLALSTASCVGAATLVFALIERPILVAGVGPGFDSGITVLRESLLDSVAAALGVMIAGGATLFLLPAIERAFDVATGMTLIELRDPRHPLLRELQIAAPGTYSHSLSVAALSEAAADAIGADGLLAYVGALYHDVGKMSKPGYFVENQQGGPNRHDKLSPAMSLLVVVGHVKDGMELAREHRLPKSVQHFVESHHGTTLVEFFYHRARKHAEGRGRPEEAAQVPDEFEYRYPGPKPRTKEAAVLMIADASESATRALADPTPARIDALVRAIANKRLLDGQFDDCELTLRELTMIVESVVRSLQGMYHGRVAYPEADQGDQQGPSTSDLPPTGLAAAGG